MKSVTLMVVAMLTAGSWAHVPSLLLPLKGTPISSYFLGQSDISRAIFSELTGPDQFFVAVLEVKSSEPTLVQLYTPECSNIPSYEIYQPSALVIKGDLSWKVQGETNMQYILRIRKSAVGEVSSDYVVGQRPQYYEEHGKMNYWVGGEWKGSLAPGLYSIVVFNEGEKGGNFTLGLNSKEAWTPDLYKYVAEIMPVIKLGFCSDKGFSGKLEL